MIKQRHLRRRETPKEFKKFIKKLNNCTFNPDKRLLS